MRVVARASTPVRVRWLAAMFALSSCAPPRERADTVVYATGADLEGANPITTVHPLARQVQRYALLVTLVRLDSALRPVPYAARTWRWGDRRASVTFALDTALRWHDGVSTTAADVAFTLNAARDPRVGSPRAAELAVVDTAIAVSPDSVQVRFRRPVPDLPTVLAELAIAPAHLLDTVPATAMRRAAFNLHPVGNGPFRFVRRDAGRRWVFERNPDFPQSLGGPPDFAHLVVALVDEPTTKFAGLVSGDLDVAGIAPGMARLVDRDPSLRLLSYPVLFVNALVFNTTRPPFDDPRVRTALDALIDRQRIVSVALAGYATPADGPVPPTHPAWAPHQRPSARQADSLLEAAGWRRQGAIRVRDGQPLRFELLTVGSGDNTVEQLIQGDFRAHGIDMAIRQLELGAFLAQARAVDKHFDALITGIPGDLALAYLAAMFDGRLRGGALDYAGFHTPALDSAFARVAASATDSAQREAWHDVQALLAADVPVAWLYHSKGVQGVQRRLGGVVMDLRGEMVSLARWTLDSTRTASVGR